MRWVTPTEEDAANGTLKMRLWDGGVLDTRDEGRGITVV
jgi:hypothetical protein